MTLCLKEKEKPTPTGDGVEAALGPAPAGVIKRPTLTRPVKRVVVLPKPRPQVPPPTVIKVGESRGMLLGKHGSSHPGSPLPHYSGTSATTVAATSVGMVNKSAGSVMNFIRNLGRKASGTPGVIDLAT